MSRPRYTVTEDDVANAYAYLSDKMLSYRIELSGDVSYQDARDELANRSAIEDRSERADAINTWCETHLSRKEWSRLKSGIRKRRERQRSDNISIDVSAKSHELLTKLAKRDGVTFSRVLEFYLEKAVRSSGRRPAKAK